MQGRQVVEGHMAEAGQLRFKAVFQCARRRRQCRETAPMATIARADDAVGPAAMQLAPLARQLDRRFAGLGATVEQVGLVAAGTMAQAVDKVELSAVMQAHARIDQGLRLVGEGFDQDLRAVAEAVGSVALAEIQVGTVVAVPQPGTLAAYEHLSWSRYRGHQRLTGQRIG